MADADPASDARRVFRLGLLGAVTMFLVQPPADLFMLAWVAPLPWLLLVRDGTGTAPHPWRSLWAAGSVHWLLTIHWLRLPHPATSIGWVALSVYLGAYLPLFVWGARRLMTRWRWPLMVAAPGAWMGCEQARGSFLGGFPMGGLGATQWRWTEIIQIADWAGGVGVGGLVTVVAATLVTALTITAPFPGSGSQRIPARRRLGALFAGGLVLAAAWGYGAWRMATAPVGGRVLDILLVQGSIDTELKHDPQAAAAVLAEYDGLTMGALGDGPRPDLIVWPETMWRWALLEIDPDDRLPDDVVAEVLGPVGDAFVSGGDDPDAAAEGVESDATRQARCRAILEQDRIDPLAAHARRYGTNWLVGIDRQLVSKRSLQGVFHFNSALFMDAAGRSLGRYDKMFPVAFGETVPLADRFPWLYALTPLPAGLTAGRHPLAVPIAGIRVAPTICYETALPGAVRTVVNRLDRAGSRPEILVNLTNDGWFWGSSELDMHLACGILRAVEVRTPLAIAANTGFSAVIDGCGRLLERGPRRAPGTIRAQLSPDGRKSLWLAMGPLPTAVCLAVLVAAIAEGAIFRGRRPLQATLQATLPATLPATQTLPAGDGSEDGMQDR